MDVRKFITFEGGDGTGKSVQIEKLYQRLKQSYALVHLTREPGGTVLGETLRTLLLNTPDLYSKTLCALFVAARQHHWMTVIKPALEQGFWVLCDRFIHSTFVYQGLVGGLEFSFIRLLHEQLETYIFPGLTFVLQANPKISYERCKKRHYHQTNYLDQQSFFVHCAIENSYRQLNLGNIIQIPPNTLEKTEIEVWKKFQNYLLDKAVL
ncbi:dTMP kinase [Holospora curviuscula]|uniref:Thymidylate kinase n=1 Tax=Holospora curviuscula TaxID=1082868 RepID=A0A2S5R893_9PROT|nr:dTMP kinase [Holospora curviuscula]PPE03559.1 Thymidylate kinase [Holospora curviuscula]